MKVEVKLKFFKSSGSCGRNFYEVLQVGWKWVAVGGSRWNYIKAYVSLAGAGKTLISGMGVEASTLLPL